MGINIGELPTVVISEAALEWPVVRTFVMAQVCDRNAGDAKLVIRSTIPGGPEENYLGLHEEVHPHVVLRRGHGQLVVFDRCAKAIEINARDLAVREHALGLFRKAYPDFVVSLMRSH